MARSKEDIKQAKKLKDPRQRKKLTEMQSTDGKLYNKYGVKSLDELIRTEKQTYSTTDLGQYQDYLNSLDTADLHRHSAEVGVLPNADRHIIIRRLEKEFLIRNSAALNKAQQVDYKKKITREVASILAEGR